MRRWTTNRSVHVRPKLPTIVPRRAEFHGDVVPYGRRRGFHRVSSDLRGRRPHDLSEVERLAAEAAGVVVTDAFGVPEPHGITRAVVGSTCTPSAESGKVLAVGTGAVDEPGVLNGQMGGPRVCVRLEGGVPRHRRRVVSGAESVDLRDYVRTPVCSGNPEYERYQERDEQHVS